MKINRIASKLQISYEKQLVNLIKSARHLIAMLDKPTNEDKVRCHLMVQNEFWTRNYKESPELYWSRLIFEAISKNIKEIPLLIELSKKNKHRFNGAIVGIFKALKHGYPIHTNCVDLLASAYYKNNRPPRAKKDQLEIGREVAIYITINLCKELENIKLGRNDIWRDKESCLKLVSDVSKDVLLQKLSFDSVKDIYYKNLKCPMQDEFIPFFASTIR